MVSDILFEDIDIVDVNNQGGFGNHVKLRRDDEFINERLASHQEGSFPSMTEVQRACEAFAARRAAKAEPRPRASPPAAGGVSSRIFFLDLRGVQFCKIYM